MGRKASKVRPTSRRKSRRGRKWLTMIAALGLPLGFGVAYLGWTYGWTNATAKGYPAPPFVLPDHVGRPVALADYLGRKPVVLVFYMMYG